MIVTKIQVKGYFEENCYFCIDENTKHGFLIDPGAQSDMLLEVIRQKGWKIEKILLTHGHFDHFGAAVRLREKLGIPVLAYKTANNYLLNARLNLSEYCGNPIFVQDAQLLDNGENIVSSANPYFSLKVISTPGHTPDSVVFYSDSDKIAFVGDTIFKGRIGNYHYPGGNPKDLEKSIIYSIFTLPDDTILLSGHSQKTTVGEEKSRYIY